MLESYTYDALNRLKTYTRAGGGSQTYVYDAFGNRAVLGTSYIPASALTPQVSADLPANVQALFPGNRWTALGYDAAGNVASEAAGTGRSYTYDAENRVKTAAMPGTPAITYSYDGEGRRIRKELAGQATTVFVYDAAGQLAMEFGPPAGAEVQYLTADHLGSTRLVTDKNGAEVKRVDFLPFGEEYPAVGYPSATEKTLVKFTGKERDAETGLDYFGARYMSAAQGRFTSPDIPLLDQNPGDPQSWNLYGYVRNNPLIFTDPTGNDCVYVNSGGDGIDSINNQNTAKDCGKTGGYWVDGTVTNARFAHGSLILTGTTNGENRTSASYGLGPDPGLLALQRGTQLAEPGVNLATQGLMVFGSIVAPLPMALAQCGAGNCSKSGIAMAMLPEIGALKAGGTLLKLGVASGKGAEIIQKAGGAAQAAKDFAALGGTEVINGGVRIRTLSDGTRAVLYTATSTGEASPPCQHS